jgi:hypothetical protein
MVGYNVVVKAMEERRKIGRAVAAGRWATTKMVGCGGDRGGGGGRNGLNTARMLWVRARARARPRIVFI